LLESNYNHILINGERQERSHQLTKDSFDFGQSDDEKDKKKVTLNAGKIKLGASNLGGSKNVWANGQSQGIVDLNRQSKWSEWTDNRSQIHLREQEHVACCYSKLSRTIESSEEHSTDQTVF